MCHLDPAPLPGFQAPQTAIDLVFGVLFLLSVFVAALVYVNNPRSLGHRWFGRRGAIIVSLAPGLCALFAFCMMWLFLIPSSEAIKHWDVVQLKTIMPPCTVDDLDAAYNSAFDRLGAYYNWLFGFPGVFGVFGLFLLGVRVQSQPQEAQ